SAPEPSFALAKRQLVQSRPRQKVRDVVRRNAPGSTLVPEILNCRTSARTILDIEVTTAGVSGSSPGIRHECAEALAESPLEFCLQRSVVRPAYGQGVVNTCAHPRHCS